MDPSSSSIPSHDSRVECQGGLRYFLVNEKRAMLKKVPSRLSNVATFLKLRVGGVIT